jgi:hypothetical protein
VGSKRTAPAAAQAVPAQADVLAGEMVDDAQEAVGIPITMVPHVNVSARVAHAPFSIGRFRSIPHRYGGPILKIVSDGSSETALT